MREKGSECLNCGAEVGDRYCSDCGQDSHRRLESLWEFTRRTVAELFEIDGKLLRSLRTLLVAPGRLTREYSEGRFEGQVAPSRLYLASAAIYFLIAPRLTSGVITVHEEQGTYSTMSFGPLTWDLEYQLLLLVPIWAAALRAAHPRIIRFYEQAFVFSVHYHVVFLIVMAGLAVLDATLRNLNASGVAMWVVPTGAVVLLPYLAVALGRAFDLAPLRRAFTTVLLFVAHLGIGQLLYNFMTTASLTG